MTTAQPPPAGETTPMGTHLDALRSSADLLGDLVSPLDDDQLGRPAYPLGWTIADVLSHIGSGAVILQRRLEDALADQPTPDEFAPSVWDTWNAKSAGAKADDALLADRALLERLDGLPDTERSSFHFALGPMTFDFAGFVGLRLNEHALHTWDIHAALDPAAVVAPEAAALVVDGLDLIARYTAKPIGTARTVTIHTTNPVRQFTIDLADDTVALSAGAGGGPPDLTVPAEAFVRLIYGRLDAGHTPAVEGDRSVLDDLRRVFPGP
jgi:uncharacterized protein (TIGR03083 family)